MRKIAGSLSEVEVHSPKLEWSLLDAQEIANQEDQQAMLNVRCSSLIR
jgi:hypothetical protein